MYFARVPAGSRQVPAGSARAERADALYLARVPAGSRQVPAGSARAERADALYFARVPAGPRQVPAGSRQVPGGGQADSKQVRPFERPSIPSTVSVNQLVATLYLSCLTCHVLYMQKSGDMVVIIVMFGTRADGAHAVAPELKFTARGPAAYAGGNYLA